MIHLTFDQDWAPAWATLRLHQRLTEAGLAATLFVTHDCPSLPVLRASGRWELGWHPNFLPGSSHGDSVEAVLATLRAIVPEAVGVRAHCLLRSTPLLLTYGQWGLRYEASDLLDGMAGLRPMASWNGVVRLPIYWEDDVHLLHRRALTLEAMALDTTGLRTLTFHPVLVALNAATLEGYSALKSDLAARQIPLTQASEDDFAAFRNHNALGLADLFDAVLVWLASEPAQYGGPLRSIVDAPSGSVHG